MWKGLLVVVGLLIVVALLFGSTYNGLVKLDETVKNAWAEVDNQLKRRMDLIPNLVNTVKGYAKFEQETLEGVIQARANASKMEVNAGDLVNNPEQMQQFMNAQNGLSSALSRLMVVVERYPDLKANQNFLDLQAQLEGTENRLTVARRNYNETVKGYNTQIRVFPRNFIAGMLGFQQRPYFEAPPEAQQAPVVDFN